MKYLVLAISILFLSSCRKTYTCYGTTNGVVSPYVCKHCTKKDVDAYKAEIESKGHTDVSCETK